MCCVVSERHVLEMVRRIRGLGMEVRHGCYILLQCLRLVWLCGCQKGRVLEMVRRIRGLGLDVRGAVWPCCL